MKEDDLTLKDVLNLINNKHVDCKKYQECNDEVIEYELNVKPRFDANWICPFICEHYEKDEDIEHKICHFTEEEMEKVSKEVDSMDEDDLYRLFSHFFNPRQHFEKYHSGGRFGNINKIGELI